MPPEQRERFNQKQEDLDKLLHPKSVLDDENSIPRQLLRHPEWSADTKILKQMSQRGWTEDDINEVIKEGSTGKSRDTRWTKEGGKLDDPATVYGKPGKYVIINDRTNDVTQVSGKNKPGWIDDPNIEWKK